MIDEAEYAPFPTTVEDIKHDIQIRREAIRIMFGEITALVSHLKQAMGPAAYIQYMAEEGAKTEADLLGKMKVEEEENA